MKNIYRVMSILSYGLGVWALFIGEDLTLTILAIAMGGICDCKSRIINLEERM